MIKRKKKKLQIRIRDRGQAVAAVVGHPTPRTLVGGGGSRGLVDMFWVRQKIIYEK